MIDWRRGGEEGESEDNIHKPQLSVREENPSTIKPESAGLLAEHLPTTPNRHTPVHGQAMDILETLQGKHNG